MAALGHVWTAPWQELSDASAALVGCGHVSGLLMRRVWPLALLLCADRVPNKCAHFRSRALTQAGSPEPPSLMAMPGFEAVQQIPVVMDLGFGRDDWGEF